MRPRDKWLIIGGVAIFAGVVIIGNAPSADGPLARLEASSIPSATPFPSLSATATPVATPEPAPEFDYQLRWPTATLAITQCVNTGRRGSDLVVKDGTVARVGGTLINITDLPMDYIISVNANHGDHSLGTGEVELIRVEPNKSVPWSTTAVVTNSYPGQALTCNVLNVHASE